MTLRPLNRYRYLSQLVVVLLVLILVSVSWGAKTTYLGLEFGSSERENKNLTLLDGTLGVLLGPSTSGTFSPHIPSISGTPPAADCNASLEYGTTRLDNTAFAGGGATLPRLFICTVDGWRALPLGPIWVFNGLVVTDGGIQIGDPDDADSISLAVQTGNTLNIGLPGFGSGSLRTEDDITAGDDLTVTDDATVTDLLTTTRLTLDGPGSGTVAIVQTVANTATVTGNLDVSGILSAGSVQIAGGTAIAKHLSASATIDFTNAATGVCSPDFTTFTVTGAALGNRCVVAPPVASINTGSIFWCWVSATNTATVRHCNVSGAGNDPASGTYNVDVWS